MTSEDGTALSGVQVKVEGREHGVTTTELGEFWRLLLPDDYTLQVLLCLFLSLQICIY